MKIGRFEEIKARVENYLVLWILNLQESNMNKDNQSEKRFSHLKTLIQEL